MKGKVYLVGSGPGAEGLLTQRGRAVIDKADVVLFDQLPGEEILATLPAKAEKIDCGKFGGKHILEQDEIEALMVDRAQKGKIVVRLKAATRSCSAGAARNWRPSGQPASRSRWCRASPAHLPCRHRWVFP
jgi:precorrin-4 methylase